MRHRVGGVTFARRSAGRDDGFDARRVLRCQRQRQGALRFGVEDLLEQGVLEEVLPDFKPPSMPVSIIYSHNRHLSPRVRAFVDWLTEIMSVHWYA